MKNNIPFKLYSGLGISIFLVLMVGYFSISTLNDQVEKTTHLINIKKIHKRYSRLAIQYFSNEKCKIKFLDHAK